MEDDKLVALLGRPLSPTEQTNKDLYLDIAKEQLENLLCISLDVNPEGSGDAEADTRTFEIREGYSTVFTGIFTSLTEVKVDDVATTDYYNAYWDKRSNSYYNSIVLDECGGSEVEITGIWGFNEVPNDLQMLWAQLFANVSKKYAAGSGNIKSKKVEDFSITYGDLSDDEVFMKDNALTIRKYSLCTIGYVRHGKTCTHGGAPCGNCI
jgi:hypothetical protein